MIEKKEVYSVAEAAVLLGVHHNTLLRWIQRGKFETLPRGGPRTKIRIPASALEAEVPKPKVAPKPKRKTGPGKEHFRRGLQRNRMKA